MICKTAMSLDEIKAEMEHRLPSLSGFVGGWASTDDHQSNLGNVGVEPPKSSPTILDEDGCVPRRLLARFYYWTQPAKSIRETPGYDPLKVRLLSAVDVVITKPADDLAGLLFSTRTRSYLGGDGRIIGALEKIFRMKDVSAKINRNTSHLRLNHEEIFLWLPVRHRDNPKLSDVLELDLISGISSRDGSMRTADLREGVDFDRSNFLTSVAEGDVLGPIDMSFINIVDGENHSYNLKIHFDGGFEIRKNNIRVPDSLDRAEFMLETSIYLAYDVIPKINDTFKKDAKNWFLQRDTVIRDARSSLETRYRTLKTE